jgi:glutamate-1-semialdehyde 2,1-aminomutase
LCECNERATLTTEQEVYSEVTERQRSQRAFTRSLQTMPGGNTRTATYYQPFPVVVARGEGCHVTDIDGNRYIDLLNNYTSLVHGHAHPLITDRLMQVISGGTVFPSPIEAQVELAERLVARLPSVDLVRFTNSGTEAVLWAVRAARAYTGRDTIVQAHGSYHGGWEQVSALPERGEPTSRGIPGRVRDLVLGVPYNDIGALEALMGREGANVAAILLEPVLGHTITPGTAEFLHAAQRLAHEHGALLVLDEVITARMSTAGCQGLLGLTPDLTALGKIIGGGMPVGAFGGRRDIMELFDPRGELAMDHHGTFNGNVLSMEAGVVSFDLLNEAEITRIDDLGKALEIGLRHAIDEVGLQAEVRRAGSILHIDSPLMASIHQSALEQGVYIAPRGQLSISTPMTEGIVAQATERLALALRAAAAFPA